jgi:lipopolysaccharide transport system permease protein
MIHSGENLIASRSRFRYWIPLTYQFDVISHLVVRNFLVKYKGAMLGVLWAIFVPLSQFLVLAFIFGKVMPLGIEGYPAFLFIGILPWTWFSLCLSSAGLLFISNRDLMRKANFVPLNLIIVDVLINLLGFLLLLPILFLVVISYHREITIYIIYLPIILLVQTLFTIGLSLIIATLNVFYRDIQHIVTIIVMLLFFITPIFYGKTKIDPDYQFMFKLNPMAVLIDAYRQVFFYGLPPDWMAMLYPSIVSILTCFAGYILYRNQLHKIFDLI